MRGYEVLEILKCTELVAVLQRSIVYTVEPLYCGHLGGPSKVSCIERCPHFRGKFLFKTAQFGHSKVSLVQRCPYFRVSFKRGSTVCILGGLYREVAE